MRNSGFVNQLKTEVKYMFCNSAVFMILALAPIFYGLFYSYPYKNEVPRKIPAALVDEDHTQISRKLASMLNGSDTLDIIAYPFSFEEAKQLFYNRDIYSIVIVPKGFSADILSGRQADISVYSDGSYVMYYKESYTGVQLTAGTLGAGITLEKLAGGGVPGKVAMRERTSVVLNSVPLYNPAGGYATYVLPAVFILISHQLMIIGIAMVMAEERNSGEFFHISGDIRITPLTRLGAKLFLNFIIMLVQSLFLYGVVLPLFDIPFSGNYTDLLLFLFPFFLTVIFMGIFIGSFMKDSAIVIIYIAVTSIPLLFISGVPWAKYSMPAVVGIVSNIFPSTHGINGFVRIYREGASLADVAQSVTMLWAMAAVFFISAFKRISVLSEDRNSLKIP